MVQLYIVILAGGSGTRFWPESRMVRPKQLLPITGKKPMIVETAERVSRIVPKSQIFVVTHEKQAAAVRHLLPKIPARNILAEPLSKNTATSIGWAAVSLPSRNPKAVMVILPADHAIETKERFARDLRIAAQGAQRGGLFTFGIRPTFPSTGYGYLQRGEMIDCVGKRAIYRVRRFTEKPNRPKAQAFVKSGNYFWNSGMFLWRVDQILSAIQFHLPGLYSGLSKIQKAHNKKSFRSILRREYKKFHSISIDYGVMEKARDVRMIEASFRWSDVGSWSSLADLVKRGGEPNVSLFPGGGEFLQIDSRNCLAFSEKPHLIAGIGLDNLVIVRTPDATLVCRKDRAEEVKAIVEMLQRRKQTDYL